MQLNPADAARVQVCPWHRGLKYNKISKDAYTDLVAGLTPEGEMPADINILVSGMRGVVELLGLYI